jgi:multidrug efflux pump subunit AcrA (membrane-fusion protein)
VPADSKKEGKPARHVRLDLCVQDLELLSVQRPYDQRQDDKSEESRMWASTSPARFWGAASAYDAATRIADALQPGTRTLLTEIDIPNPDGALTPGIYCMVELHIPRKTPSLSVPAHAIIFNRDGMQVAVVSNGKAEIRKVRVKRDLGTRVEVDTGVKPGDEVVLNPPVNLVDGSKVQPRPETPEPGR